MTFATRADQLNTAIYDSAAQFMLDDATAARGMELGFADVLEFYWAGRLGALGRTTPEVAAAAHGFLAPQEASKVLPPLWEVCEPMKAALTYVECEAQYAEARLAEVSDERCSRTAELATKVVDNVPITALFGAWRALPSPRSPRARAAHSLNLLREWRAGIHVGAIISAGRTPLEAIMADSSEAMSRSSEFYAQLFGWPEPWPSADDSGPAMQSVSQAVNNACGHFLEQNLSADEADELVELSRQLCAKLA